MGIDINELRVAAEAGQRDQVLTFLTQYLNISQDDKEAWLLFAQLSTDLSQCRSAFIRVLRLDPQNRIAREGLEKLTSESPASKQNSQTQYPPPSNTPPGFPSYQQPAERNVQAGSTSPVSPSPYKSYYQGNIYTPNSGDTSSSFLKRAINWIRLHPKETIIACSTLVIIVILALILSATLKTNALLGRWDSPGGWIEFLENGTLIINQPSNVQIFSYRILDDHRIEFKDAKGNIDIRFYNITNNILQINNNNYSRADQKRITAVSITPTPLTSTASVKITPTIASARPEDLAATLPESQEGWFVVVDGKPVKMSSEALSFNRSDIYSINKFPKLNTSVPVILVKDKYFTNHSMLEIRTIGGGTGLKLSVSDNLIRVVGSSNDEPNKVGVKLGDAIIAVEGKEVGSDLKLASSLLVGTFGTKARIKLLSGTTMREIEIPRVVQVVQSTLNPKIEPVAKSTSSFVRLLPTRPLSKGLNCFYYTYNVGINTHNEIYCFVLD